MLCSEFPEKLEAFVDEQLPEPEMARLREHIARCPACARLVDERLEMRRQVRRVLATPAPPDLREAIVATAAKHQAIMDDEDWDDDFADEELEDRITGTDAVTTRPVHQLGRDEIAVERVERGTFRFTLRRALPFAAALLLIAAALATRLFEPAAPSLRHGAQIAPLIRAPGAPAAAVEFGGMEFEGSLLTSAPPATRNPQER